MTRDRRRSGYCTNVHAGADLATTRANLERHALAVKQAVSPDAPMGLGLWLTAAAAREMRARDQVAPFAEWLAQVGLVPFTFNGFPYGDFHQPVVKHRVYEPTWADPARRDYTLDLIAIQHALLPSDLDGSISTLPIAWARPSDADLDLAGQHLAEVAVALAQLESETGRLITLCLEPEPGCLLQRKGDLPWLFDNWILRHGKEAIVRRYLRACHDVCHSVVMFESQEETIRTYQAAGIGIGKVQVSSAIRVDFATLDGDAREQAVAQLRGFAEDRYLHQTCVRAPGKRPTFYEDLPHALATAADPRTLTSEWRIHFHVPVYLERFGQLETSRDDVEACLRACAAASDVTHYEVETYAWSVLPQALRRPTLADGIADEMRWFWAHT